MRIAMNMLIGLALVLGAASTGSAFGHHKSPEKEAHKDIHKARKKAAKQDRPKVLHHHHK